MMKKCIIFIIFFLCSTVYSHAALHPDYRSRNMWHTYHVKHFIIERFDREPSTVYMQSYVIGRVNVVPIDTNDIPDIEYYGSKKFNDWDTPPLQDGWLYIEPIDSK